MPARGGRQPDAHLARIHAAPIKQHVDGVLVAARLQHGDGGQLVALAGVVALQQDRGARLLQHGRGCRHCFAVERRFDAGQQIGVMRGERGIRGLAAHAGIGRHQREARRDAAQIAAQAVVDADLVQAVCGQAGDGVAGQRRRYRYARCPCGSIDHAASAREVERAVDIASMIGDGAREPAGRQLGGDLGFAVEIGVGQLAPPAPSMASAAQWRGLRKAIIASGANSKSNNDSSEELTTPWVLLF